MRKPSSKQATQKTLVKKSSPKGRCKSHSPYRPLSCAVCAADAEVPTHLGPLFLPVLCDDDDAVDGMVTIILLIKIPLTNYSTPQEDERPFPQTLKLGGADAPCPQAESMLLYHHQLCKPRRPAPSVVYKSWTHLRKNNNTHYHNSQRKQEAEIVLTTIIIIATMMMNNFKKEY